VARAHALDYGRSIAISVAVAILTYRHSGSNWTNPDTDADIFRACRYCRAYACRGDYRQYVLHELLLPSVVNPRPRLQERRKSAHVPTFLPAVARTISARLNYALVCVVFELPGAHSPLKRDLSIPMRWGRFLEGGCDWFALPVHNRVTSVMPLLPGLPYRHRAQRS